MRNTIDWKTIYSIPLMDTGPCYLQCGGYCCRNFYAEDFQILGSKGVVLPLIESEFEHLRSAGGIDSLMDDVRCETFEPIEGHTLKLYFLNCRCEGLCNPHGNRPFICRLYPYLPRVDFDGNIVGFHYAALVDLFYPEIARHPCYLVRERREEMQSQLRESLQPLTAGNPEMIFLLKAAELIVGALLEKMTDKLDPDDEASRKKFLKKFEYMVFTRAAWRTPSFQKEMVELYRRTLGQAG